MKTVSKLAVAGAAAAILAVGALAAQPASAQNNGKQGMMGAQIAPGLMMPAMDPVRGMHLFAEKGCVVCHSINGVGGTDAPHLDASTMTPMMDPFDFFAKMWRGAIPMINMQHHEIGHQIEFTGQDLADIVAFAHNARVQKMFTEKDIPESVKKMMDE